MLKPVRHQTVTRTIERNAGPASDCHVIAGSPKVPSSLFSTPEFWSNTRTPISAVATPETAIGRMRSERNSGLAGSAVLSSVAATRPNSIDTGVTISVNRTVLPSARQKSVSDPRRA